MDQGHRVRSTKATPHRAATQASTVPPAGPARPAFARVLRLLLVPLVAAAVFGCRSAASDLTPAPAAAPPQHDGETAGPVENTLNWSTASEVDNFGFDIYRATTEEGPFTRITQEPIQGAGTTDEPQHYSFVDDTIESGTGYYYYIESISMTGARERFSPVVFAKPKEQPLPIGENADP